MLLNVLLNKLELKKLKKNDISCSQNYKTSQYYQRCREAIT